MEKELNHKISHLEKCLSKSNDPKLQKIVKVAKAINSPRLNEDQRKKIVSAVNAAYEKVNKSIQKEQKTEDQKIEKAKKKVSIKKKKATRTKANKPAPKKRVTTIKKKSRNYTYIPNDKILKIEAIKDSGNTVDIKAPDILDGAYVKKHKYAKGGHIKDEEYVVFVVPNEEGQKLGLKPQNILVKADSKKEAERLAKKRFARQNQASESLLAIETIQLKSWVDRFQVKNQYEGHTAKEVWNALNFRQREHFLKDHRMVAEIKIEDIQYAYGCSWDELSKEFKAAAIAFEEHVKEGQYAKGGRITDEDAPAYSRKNYVGKRVVIPVQMDKNFSFYEYMQNFKQPTLFNVTTFKNYKKITLNNKPVSKKEADEIYEKALLEGYKEVQIEGVYADGGMTGIMQGLVVHLKAPRSNDDKYLYFEELDDAKKYVKTTNDRFKQLVVVDVPSQTIFMVENPRDEKYIDYRFKEINNSRILNKVYAKKLQGQSGNFPQPDTEMLDYYDSRTSSEPTDESGSAVYPTFDDEYYADGGMTGTTAYVIVRENRDEADSFEGLVFSESDFDSWLSEKQEEEGEDFDADDYKTIRVHVYRPSKYSHGGIPRASHIFKNAKNRLSSGYSKSKEYAKQKVKDFNKKVALDVLDKTKDKVGNDQKMHLKAAQEIIKNKYESGGLFGGRKYPTGAAWAKEHKYKSKESHEKKYVRRSDPKNKTYKAK